MRKASVVLMSVFVMVFVALYGLSQAATITVTTTEDEVDAGDCGSITIIDLPGPDGKISLREAICAANNTPNTEEPDVIKFDMDEDDLGYIDDPGYWSIKPNSGLPEITDPVVIDGYSQEGASLATETDPATLMIELDGSDAGGDVCGLVIYAGSSTVKGLVINRFDSRGVKLEGDGDNVIEGNYIGTNVDGTEALANRRNGVLIFKSHNNTIGGTEEGARNVISGNGSSFDGGAS